MRLSSTVLVAIVATLHASCIVGSAAISDAAIASVGEKDLVHSPPESLHGGTRFLRAPEATGHKDEEGGDERGFNFLRSKSFKLEVQKWIKNPEIYNDFIGGKRTTWEVYGAWQKLGASPEKIVKAMKDVGYGHQDFEYIVTGYRQYLENMKHVQME